MKTGRAIFQESSATHQGWPNGSRALGRDFRGPPPSSLPSPCFAPCARSSDSGKAVAGSGGSALEKPLREDPPTSGGTHVRGSRGTAHNAARRAAACGDARRARKLTSRGDVEPVDVSGRQPALVVAYLPHSATDVDVREAFQPFGRVNRAAIVKDVTGASKCYGFVSFDSPASAGEAILACRQGIVVMTASDGAQWSLKANWVEPQGHWGLRTRLMKQPPVMPELLATSAPCIETPVEGAIGDGRDPTVFVRLSL